MRNCELVREAETKADYYSHSDSDFQLLYPYRPRIRPYRRSCNKIVDDNDDDGKVSLGIIHPVYYVVNRV